MIFCADVKLTWKIEEANIEIIREFQLYKTSLFEGRGGDGQVIREDHRDNGWSPTLRYLH